MGLGFGVMVGVGVLGVALGLITRRPLVSNNVTDLALWPLELSSGLTAEELMLKLSGGDSSVSDPLGGLLECAYGAQTFN